MKTNFAELHHQVAFGKAGGKIIWQPRIGCWYYDKVFEDQPLPAPFPGMDLPAIYRELNCSARIYEYRQCFVPVEHPSVNITTRDDGTDIETIFETPVGKQIQILHRTSNSRVLLHLKWEVSDEEELKVATWRKENTTYGTR